MKAVVFLEDFVEESEFLYPLYRLREAGFDTRIAAPERRTYKGKNGLPLKPEITLDEVDPQDLDLVFIPGGYAPDRLRRSPQVLGIVRTVYERGKPVVTICHGPWVLISAGLVKGKTVTGYFAIKDDLINAGARYTGNPVEKDGNLYTATDPRAMPELFKTLLKDLGLA